MKKFIVSLGVASVMALGGCAQLDKLAAGGEPDAQTHFQNEKLKGCDAIPGKAGETPPPGKIASTPSPGQSDQINCR